jgi:hypothetical protein
VKSPFSPLRHSVLLLFLGLTACAPDAKPSASTTTRQTLSERLDATKPEPSSYKQDSEGKWIAQTGKRSPFEGKTDPNFANKNFTKQPYKTPNYAKKSWWGSKDYSANKSYKGNTDASRFQKSAAQQGKNARESGTANAFSDKPYATGDYATSSARESTTAAIKKGSNDSIENRRKSFAQPEVTDWQQRRDLSVEQTKGILGQ